MSTLRHSLIRLAAQVPELRPHLLHILAGAPNRVSKLISIKAGFETLDEWHDTVVYITLQLESDAPMPEQEVKRWLQQNWHSIRNQIREKPPMEDEDHRYAWDDDDYDDDEDRDEQDWVGRPAPGLGWMLPNRMDFNDFESYHYKQKHDKMEVRLTIAIRD